MSKPEKHWAVEVREDGEPILTIERNSSSSATDIDSYRETIETCMDHLSGFMGLYRQTPEATNALKLAWSLSIWAAAINWSDRETNTKVWLDGLRSRIEEFQSAATDLGVREP